MFKIKLRFEDLKMFDISNVGHSEFGFVLATSFILIAQVLQIPVLYTLFFFPVATIIFIGWDILEHTLIKKYIYPKIFPNIVWKEHLENIIIDQILEHSIFYCIVCIFHIYYQNLFITIILFIISIILIAPICFLQYSQERKR